MTEVERFARRLEAVGASLPEELLPGLAQFAEPWLTALDALASLDLGDVEPFAPARLVADAER